LNQMAAIVLCGFRLTRPRSTMLQPPRSNSKTRGS
jgi:hypothetical protein